MELDYLGDGELQELDRLEEVIERGLKTFTEVGNALLVIRDGKLYRGEYDTFEQYCNERWGFNRARAYQLMEAADVTSTIVDKGLPAPANEGQARELARAPEGEREEVWRETLDRTAGKPTAAEVRKTREARQPEPVPEPVFDDDPPLFEPPAPKPAPVMLTLRTHAGEEVPYRKPQAPATFNQTDGDGISWAKWSWNPVTGCLHGCEYCYARAIAARWADAYPAGFTPLRHEERDSAPANTVIPAAHRDESHPNCGSGDCDTCAWRRVFVCSMADLYGRWVPSEWIADIHEAMMASPRWQYILLTKFPDRYPGLEFPPGAWVGTSVDEQKRVRIAERAFGQLPPGVVKWLSLEPLREPLSFTDLSVFDWVVIGAQTQTMQPGGAVPGFQPEPRWVTRILHQAAEAGVSVHLKPNMTRFRAWLNQYPVSSQGDRTT